MTDTRGSAARFADTISGQSGAQRVLLVWDAPNMDMGLGSILGGRPTAAHRPRFDALGRWLLQRTADISAQAAVAAYDHSVGDDATDDYGSSYVDDSSDVHSDVDDISTTSDAAVQIEPEATVFTNIVPGSADVVRPWVDALRNVGYAVFAKPKLSEDSDVDPDMLDHIELRRHTVGLAGLIVASADGQAFRDPLVEIAAEGVPVTVIGFREHVSWALSTDGLEFVDLEEIPGVFREPLPRIGLDSLPDDGAWLTPFRPLRALLR
ncbi:MULTISPECIES: NYN domain-containing protein [Gordonia]|uniref:NYN domain-containing protein n=1 Tax=Gordonia TaxID=2053 RepID=UPI00257C4199|nr:MULTISPECIES: NYN domain-containing protein [Gordonia]